VSATATAERADGTASRLGVVSVVLIGLLIILLATGVMAYSKWRDEKTKHDAYADALAAAKAETLAFTTLDYRNAKASLARVQRGATGDFGQQFAKQSPAIVRLTRQNQSVSKGTVVSAGVVSMDPDSARVIVVADSRVTNKSTSKPVPRHYRLQLDLVRKGGDWLTTALEFVG
jgi:Mce-associated membrane protein